MKPLKTLLPLLALFILLNTQTCQSLSSAKVASIITNVITGKYEFNDTLWEILDYGDTLAYMKGYSIGVELLRTREDMMQVLKNSINIKELSRHLINFEERVLKIDLLYTSLVDKRMEFPNDKIKDESLTVLKNETIWNLLEPARKFRNLLYFEVTDIYHKLNGEIDAYTRTCSTQKTQYSVQSMFYEYLTLLVAVELKLFSSLKIAFETLINQADDGKDYLDGMYSARVKYLTNEHKKMISVLKILMRTTSTNIWRCEPDNYTEDESFIKLNHVFQGYIRTRADLDIYDNGKFGDTCGPKTAWFERWHREPQLCPRQCGGPLWQCDVMSEIDYDHITTICYPEKGSDRTYDFLENVDIKLVGKNKYTRKGLSNEKCETPLIDITRGLSVPYYLFYCICDDQLDYKKIGVRSDRKFYTGAVMADIAKNFVVTGARLRKEKGVIYIQIQTGKLLPGGSVDDSTVEWREIPENHLEDSSYHHQLHWEDRAIEVQDIDIPKGHALVGIRFQHVSENGVKRLRLEAFHELFDLTLGELILKQERAVYNLTAGSVSNVKQYDAYGLKVPDLAASTKYPTSELIISFATSSFESDLGQTTVPFIDNQTVTTRVPYPMSGVGLYYKISEDGSYAGFLALKLKTYDFSHFLNNVL